MEKRMKSTCCRERKFGFCIIEWIIEDFFLQACGSKWIIRSPEFLVKGCPDTKWCLMLRPKPHGNSYPLSFVIKRLHFDVEHVGVVMNMRVFGSISDHETLFVDDIFNFLKEGYECKADLKSVDFFQRKMKPFETDTLILRCCMIIYDNKNTHDSKYCTDSGATSLMKDMLNLYAKGTDYDTKMVVGDKTILAHRAILSGRNESFRKLLNNQTHETEEEPIVLKCLEFSYKGLKKILAYLYTSDLNQVLNHPSLAVYDCIIFFDIEELARFYTPEKFTVRSSLDVQSFTFTWLVKDFQMDSYVFHPYFMTENFTTKCLLLFYSKDGTEEYVPNIAEFLKESGLQKMSLEYSFLDESENAIHPVRFLTSLKDFQSSEFETFFYEDLVKTYNTDNFLRICLRLRLSKSIKKSHIEQQQLFYAEPINGDIHYFNYTRQMKNIFLNEEFADFTLKSYGKSFRVHKYILECRSNLFTKITNNLPKKKKRSHKKIEPHILKLLLLYTYSGKISNVEDDELIELYKVAIRFEMSDLKGLCTVLLEDRCETNESIRCKVLKLAEQKKDTVLSQRVERTQNISVESTPTFMVVSFPFKRSMYR